MHVQLEIHMSRSPYVQVMMNMDYNNFDYQSKNYRLEAVISFTLMALSIFLLTTFLYFKNPESFSAQMTPE